MEELELILATIQAAGEGAYSVALIYYAKEVFEIIVTSGIGIATIILAYRFGVSAFKATANAHKICDYLDMPYPYYRFEWIKVERKLKKLAENPNG